MPTPSSRCRMFVVASLLWLAAVPALAQQPFPDAQELAQAAIGGKADRTPAEQKLDSTLMFAVRGFAGSGTRGKIPLSLQPGIQSFIDENVAADQTIFVVIKAEVSPDLVAALRVVGAYDITEFPQYDTITARVPITALLYIAARTDVRTIGPRERYQTNRYFPTPEELKTRFKHLADFSTNVGSVNWEGVSAHQADKAFTTGISGAGVKVCVISDGINTLAARQASGDLPATVTVLPGQAGTGDEGTAMLEIVYDIAPGAMLGFATALPSLAQFATNIVNLRNVAGCDIIVDDYTYFNESAFQDGSVAQAVNTVTAAGALYFSSAANSGNQTHGTSGTFEGDFVASGAAIPAAIATFEGGPVVLHSFGANPYTTLTAATSAVSLKWSDPLGASANDYDLFVMDSTGTNILLQSTSNQTGTQDPYEIVQCSPSPCSIPVNSRIYIARVSGVARALRLDTHRGQISNGTTGSTFGHNAAGSALSVAAVNIATAGGGAFVGGATNPVETYSSDGPRKIFYNPNATAITPGNVLFATNGGTTLSKVDLAASDCGSTSTPGFIPFCGTSAAAPTSAAIAALIKSAKPTATKAQITTALLNSALDIEAAGSDRDSGVGIVMAPAAVRGVLSPLTVTKNFAPPVIAAGGISFLKIRVTNPNTVALQNIAFTDNYPGTLVNAATPNAAVTGAGCSASLGAVAAGDNFAVNTATIPAATTCTFTVTVTSNTVAVYHDSSGGLTTPIALNTAGAFATLSVTDVVPVTITEFSNGITARSGPAGITAGPDGNLWFTEASQWRIGRITTAGVVTEFTGLTAGSTPVSITAGPDDKLWFTEQDAAQIGRITTLGAVTEFGAGITAFANPENITAGPDGNLWFTEGHRIGRITTSGVVTEFSAGITAGANSNGGITTGPDGNLWFTEPNVNRIGRITITGVITEFNVGITGNASPSGITAGPDGNLWFTEFSGNRIGRITPAGVITEFSTNLSAAASPYNITAGPDGNLWFTENNGNRIGRITPAGVITEFSAGIAAGAGLFGITTGPDGNIWFTEINTNRIGKITLVSAVGFGPPAFSSAVSRKVHAGAGTFDLPLSAVTTNPTTEPRIGPVQTIVFTFDKTVSAATVTITEGIAVAGAPTISGSDVIVGLTGVTDQQYVTISLTNVSSFDGGTGGGGSVRIGFLAGDVNQDRVVNTNDLSLIQTQLSQPVTVANYLKDVSVNGKLSYADIAITFFNRNKALPAP